MEIALALIAGVSIGAVLGFIGAGGAMLTVPILIYLFNFTPVHATTAALKMLEHPTAIAARRGLPLEHVAPAALARASALVSESNFKSTGGGR